MPIIGKVKNTETVRESKHDPIINELLDGFAEDKDNNALIFTEEEANQSQSVYNRLVKVYAPKLEELEVKARQIPVHPVAHAEIYKQGGRKMVILAPINEEEETEEEEKSGNPFGNSPI